MPKTNQITIFGATGFLGRHVVREAAKSGSTIRVVTRNPENVLPLKCMGDVGQIVPFLGSFRNDQSVTEAIASSEIVINLTGILYENRQGTFQSIHVEGPARLARIAREKGVKTFIHISALGANPGSLSKYARSKAAGEQAVRVFFPDATILRPSLMFGPEDNFFNLFSKMADISPFIPIIGGGLTRFQPVYVGDIAKAITICMKQSFARGQTYELGGPECYNFKNLILLLLKLRSLHRRLINLPWSLAILEAAFFELLPKPLLTRDQVKLLKTDNVIKNPNAKIFEDLGIKPACLEMILPTYII